MSQIMDSVVGDDLTLPVDLNGSCRLTDSVGAAEFSTEKMTAPLFPEKMSPSKVLTMKDYENQITALKKENFNLKLRIYFMEEHMQQKCDDSTEDIFKTNIELKVELEALKREMAEKQELLVSASKALESFAGRDSHDPQQVREQAQKEMDALRVVFNKKIADLEQSLQAAEVEIDRMALIAEQEKCKSINMEKQLQTLCASGTGSHPTQIHDLQQALEEKENLISQLKDDLKEASEQMKTCAGQTGDAPSADRVKQLTDLITHRDLELETLKGELLIERSKAFAEPQKTEVNRLESLNQQLMTDLTQAKNLNETLSKTLENTNNEIMVLTQKLEEKGNEFNSEKKNALKRDKTIQGLTQILSEKEKEIAELCHEIEDRDEALSKAREAAHKAQLQKYQGAEEHQNLLMEKQTELAQLQGEHHAKVLEAQKLHRALERKEQELSDLQQAKDQLEMELEDMQQQKKKGDKAFNDLNNQLKKLSGDIKDRESALEQQYQELLDQTKQKSLAQEVTIQRLTSTVMDREQQLQEYINMIGELEHSKSSEGMAGMLSKLRQRLKEKDKALEQALDEKFAAIEDKDNEIHQLQLSLREKERDLERLNNLVSHNEDTISSFDSLIKEKDVELQHLGNTLKNVQRSRQEIEDNLSRSLREKDSIISQLQSSLESKTKNLEELTSSMLDQSQSHLSDIAEQQMGQRLKVTEAMLAQAVKDKERLIADNQSAVEGLLATINSKDQLFKDSADNYKHIMCQRAQEIEELRKQLCDRQQHLNTVEKQCSTRTQEGLVEVAQLKALLEEKDRFINKLLQQEKDRDQYMEESAHVLELRHTIKIMQDKLDEKEAESATKIEENKDDNVPLPMKSFIIVKKELQQKNEALNKALKRETELKLKLNEIEHRFEGLTANLDSLTAALKNKDEIIETLHQRIGQKSESLAEDSHDDATNSGPERFPPKLPQRERTMIGEDNEQESVSSLIVLQQEHEALNRALKKEQQLYSNLVRTVKEQDSAQRLHALQLELTAVQLLRQQLEESIKTNEELKEDLEKELHRVKLREGMDLIDPKELESMKNQLEDAHRWNVSLQARLGAIQNRGGGVGGTNDGHSLILVGDETSYMSICVGEEHDDSLSQLTSQELREKVIELQDYINRQQALNRDLQNRLTALEKSDFSIPDKEEQKMGTKICWKQQPLTAQDKESQTDVTLEKMIFGDLLSNSTDEHSGKHTQSVKVSTHKDSCMENKTMSSGPEPSKICLKETRGLQVENKQLVKEQTSFEFEESSVIGSDSLDLSQKSGKMPHTNKCLKPNNQRKSNKAGPQTAKEKTERTESTDSLRRMNATKKLGASRSRLPVPVRPKAEAGAALEHQQTQNSSSVQSSDSYNDPPVSESHTEIQQTSTPSENSAATHFEQLQQYQDREALISELQEKLTDFMELQVQLQEQTRFHLQYKEALQAAESTIAYLTACSLDNQGTLGSNATLHNKYMQLEHSLNEKDECICELTEVLFQADKALNSLKSQHYDNSGLGKDIKAVLQKNGQHDLRSSQELQSYVEWDQRMRSGQHDESQTADATDRDGKADCSSKKKTPELCEATFSHTSVSQQKTMIILMECLSATESAIASLTVHCTSSSSVTSSELQTCLEKLKRALQEKETLGDLSKFTTQAVENDNVECSSLAQTKAQSLSHNLQILHEVFRNLQQKMIELQVLQNAPRHGHSPKALPPNVQNQIETLHKELREKRKVCENLEEKLATAQSFITKATSPGAKKSALKQDEKSVQVDLQDLGYETSGKSELDREESSSTDLEVGFKPICCASSLPSLSKQEPALFSSTENLHSSSSAYPTSSVLSSAKASLKSLRRSSLSSDVVASTSETLVIREEVHREPQEEDRDSIIGQVKGKTMMDKSSCLNLSSERRSLGRSPSDLFQSRSGSTSPARLESLIQSQARELSQLRQEIKETRRLGALQRQQLEDLGKAFSNLIQSAKLDNLMGEEVKKQLDRSLAIMDSLEGRLDRSRHCLDGESHLGVESLTPIVTHRFTRELQEKNSLIQTLQSQTGGQTPSSHHSSHSDVYQLDQTTSSPHSSLSTHGSTLGQNHQHSTDWAKGVGGGVLEEGAPGHRDTAGRLQGLQRENVRLQEQLRNSTVLNTSLRNELELHCTLMAQGGSHGQSRSQSEAKATADTGSPKGCVLTPDLLAEHLQEIRALRQRLEESIRNNDNLREQLEKKLAEVEKDSVRTHIFIKDHEEHSQVSKEVQFLLQQNQTLKEQLNSESQDKQKENDKLRETLARRTAKLEHSRKECEALRQENIQVQEKLELTNQENAQLQDSLRSSKDELHRLQCEVKLQSQELADSQNLLQSLRVELQVYEKLKSRGPKSTEDSSIPQRQDRTASSDAVDLRELLSEIKHLRLQLERSIQTNMDLRQKLEEQLSREPNHLETININYLLSSPDEAARTTGRESNRPYLERATLHQDQKHEALLDEGSQSGSSVNSFSAAPSRLVPGHMMWASRNGRHILGLIEDYSALRKHISEGRKLSHNMDTQLQECMLLIKQQCSDKLMDQPPLKSLCNNMNTLQQVLEEASRLMKLLWRVSLPVDITTGATGNNQQDEQLKREISRLKNRVLQQEKMLSGAVKRLRTTNQLKEGMERVIIDQLSLTHGVLKKARGNLEEIPVDGL